MAPSRESFYVIVCGKGMNTKAMEKETFEILESIVKLINPMKETL